MGGQAVLSARKYAPPELAAQAFQPVPAQAKACGYLYGPAFAAAAPITYRRPLVVRGLVGRGNGAGVAAWPQCPGAFHPL